MRPALQESKALKQKATEAQGAAAKRRKVTGIVPSPVSAGGAAAAEASDKINFDKVDRTQR